MYNVLKNHAPWKFGALGFYCVMVGIPGLPSAILKYTLTTTYLEQSLMSWQVCLLSTFCYI